MVKFPALIADERDSVPLPAASGAADLALRDLAADWTGSESPIVVCLGRQSGFFQDDADPLLRHADQSGDPWLSSTGILAPDLRDKLSGVLPASLSRRHKANCTRQLQFRLVTLGAVC